LAGSGLEADINDRAGGTTPQVTGRRVDRVTQRNEILAAMPPPTWIVGQRRRGHRDRFPCLGASASFVFESQLPATAGAAPRGTGIARAHQKVGGPGLGTALAPIESDHCSRWTSYSLRRHERSYGSAQRQPKPRPLSSTSLNQNRGAAPSARSRNRRRSEQSPGRPSGPPRPRVMREGRIRAARRLGHMASNQPDTRQQETSPARPPAGKAPAACSMTAGELFVAPGISRLKCPTWCEAWDPWKGYNLTGTPGLARGGLLGTCTDPSGWFGMAEMADHRGVHARGVLGELRS